MDFELDAVDRDEQDIGETVVEPVPVVGSDRPRLAVIMDDIADLSTAQAIWALDVPVTVSVLPYAPEAEEIARSGAGREIFLHLPMEPVGVEDPGPYALTKALTRASLEARIAWALDQTPGVTGFNNHMGSRMTADASAMAQVFEAVRAQREDLIFIDSLTHTRSQAREAALAAGFRARDRDVFLDHDPRPDAVAEQLNRALALAVSRGDAIAIGHPRPATLEALATLAAKADAAGVEIVSVRELLDG